MGTIIWLVVVTILMLCGIGFAIYNHSAGILVGAIAGGLVLGGIGLFIGCVHKVSMGTVGIVKKWEVVQSEDRGPGWYFDSIGTSIVEMPTTVQTETFNLSVFSNDLQEVTMVYTVSYQVDPVNAHALYLQCKNDYRSTAITPNIEKSVKEATGKYTAEQLIQNRKALSSEIETILQDNVTKYYINIVSTSIENIDFTDSYTNAIEAKQVAEQTAKKVAIEQQQATNTAAAENARNLEKAKNENAIKVAEAEREAEILKVQAEAKKSVAEAEASAALTKATAEAEAIRIKGEAEAAAKAAIAAAVTKDLIELEKIQSWKGEFPDTYIGSDNVSSILDLR